LSDCTAKLEARDAHIRRHPTNLVVFVAECVRLEANADVAIIQSGAFRCDSELEPKLCVRDLRETFLYDTPDATEAIMVLEVESDVVDALIRHGDQTANFGMGAFPQIADARKGAAGTVRLAISSFLLTESNNDGYDKVLQEAWELPDLEETHDAARNASVKQFGIIAAVRAQADEATFIEPAGHAGNDAQRIIELLKTYALTFYEQMGPDATTPASTEMFRRWLGTDDPVAPSPKIEQARNAVRDFLRRLPAVAAYEKREKDWRSSWTAAQGKLEALQKDLVGHDFTFRDGADYAWLFDLAARGVPGWWRPYPD
jgi:hypothetical protein